MRPAKASTPRPLLCAIYTRKSSEEGLEQDFNSLDAQRDACAAYIVSQQSLGWIASPTVYDDGGYSGGTLERPALARLLADIQERRIQLLVVYKVDRLTRSLSDFTRLVELFDAHGVSFVSVTQQFNTTTSMGRLTLNVLLSFAQFEREVTAERIRDKIAASKRKGLWMGGIPPMGYLPSERTLRIDFDEAPRVRTIFSLYLDCGGVTQLKAELDRMGWKTRARSQTNGPAGYRPFSRGHLHRILKNPIYIGKIPHKGAIYPGKHEAIIDSPLWEAVQQQLANQANGKRRENTQIPKLLVGLLFDAQDQKLTPTYSKKGTRLYQYYVSADLHQGRHNNADQFRIPALELERTVIDAVVDYLQDEVRIVTMAKSRYIRPSETLAKNQLMAERINAQTTRHETLREVVERIIVHSGKLEIVLQPTESGFQGAVESIEVPIQIKRLGTAVRLIVGDTRSRPRIDKTLVALIAKAHRWFDLLSSGHCMSIGALAEREGVSPSYITRVIYLAFLSPEIIQRIAQGKQPVSLSAERLLKKGVPPIDWAEQYRWIGMIPDAA
ncbi:recombinase family protein [Propionivibrio dicarboxylicus]|uniref:Site-specific DNA recombinase n=1 Tax=Propionivibrio dicarboxylicus TaxID=83767 RepID=A0A1G7Z630_9RHOO|nr:recombinase family protein [Propionivibrio dicarboxylicus]SDH04055.1 Site-specific DNA recombinase [Propionivibrio dicarboxylicus]